MFLVFDTETTGLPKNFKAPITDSDNWPRLVQISWQLHNELGELVENQDFIIKPEGFEIPYDSQKIHGISTKIANENGKDLSEVLKIFKATLLKTNFIVGHNIDFDVNIIGAEFYRKFNTDDDLSGIGVIDTMKISVDHCKIPGGRGGKFKYPKLNELHKILFGEEFNEAHNSAADVQATARCFLELIRIDVISPEVLKFTNQQINEFKQANPEPIKPADIKIKTIKIDEEETSNNKQNNYEENLKLLENVKFTHLHLHTQYSILDGAAEIDDLIEKAKADDMEAIAITDHGNMFGAKLFHQKLTGNGLKPILGCEFYVARRGMKFKENNAIDKSGYHLIVLAKNKKGYENLSKLISIAWLEGIYYKPRIDKKLLKEYHEGLIVLSACLGGEIPQKIMKENTEEAEKSALWFKEVFGDDYYLELQRHKSNDPEKNANYNDQAFVNTELIKIAKKHNIKLVATNDVHYVNEEDFAAQQRLICIGTNTYLSENKKFTYSGQEWFKTQSEMKEIFKDLPEAIISTQEIVNKVENYELNRDAVMPEFDIPEDFATLDEYKNKYTQEELIAEFKEDRFYKLGGYDKVLRIKLESDYLKKITYEGAKKRWGENLSEDVKDRLDFELDVIKTMGFPGYFLIVWDFLKAAREMGVIVGPGRGSAAGSAVAYSLRITEIDPIKYDLLFERFLNPDRISMPDIDIDFDDDGRAKILKWVVDKYGEKRVAHIITFGTMAAKSAIRDVGRVQQYPLSDTDKIAKLVPEKPGTKLKDAIKEVSELKEIRNGEGEATEVLKFAEVLEGSVRNTGTHACGIIIGRDDLEKYIPVCTASGSELKYVTQYDGKHVEDIGLLKMDFLGLKTLSIIKDTIENIKLSKGIDVDIENVDLNDKETYELYSKGQTTGLFQFESDGMKKHLMDLKPSRFEDLIAMNALYRPGPMEYIPTFIKRKHGKEKIEYDLPMMSKYLEETYGITVYQEQVMLLSRYLAGFSRGESDTLRKAMGKKKIAEMEKLKVKFIEGCKANNQFVKECEESKKDIDKTIEKIWKDWEAFAKYAFNKSHATCYSYISFQTAYLKAHYPAEFMAAVLSRNKKDIKKITFFMNECKNMGINVLGPDVNESYTNFTVNKKGDIRFGLAAVKDVGSNAVVNIIEVRKDGEFIDVYNFIERVNLSAVNKKTIESLAYAGAFDDMKIQRNQFFDENGEASDNSFVMRLINYGNKYKNDQSSEPNLFGEVYNTHIEKPELPEPRDWNIIDKLSHEKEKIGIYLSSHPLDSFKMIIDKLNPVQINLLNDIDKLKDKEFVVVGYINESIERMTKKGVPYGKVTVEDLSGIYTFTFFSKQWSQWKDNLNAGYSVAIRIKVEIPSWKKDKAEYQVNVKNVDLLYNLKDKVFKSLEIIIPIENINDDLINELDKNLQQLNKGNSQLKITIFDAEKNIDTKLTSKSIKIDITEEIVNKMSKSNLYKIKIN